ncbi:MarR family winged helix-turn-helix transcriptional regulator [Mesorhizobium australicum]|uniref:Transcriptional regulator, MarR family n=1 Tax=Mesorhizobium australicum TaxID=536018 RepID=A0A1X7N7G9_9HYPH|nr:MarR family winged helix-turn-helix transcriptional regulator [Mesorhizobium australicum]SMH32483.1 transcriptional regulator, MarR family [Mesorhizobium australicum]
MAKQAGEPNNDDVAASEDSFLAMPGHLLRRCHQIGVAVFLDECRAFDLTPLQFSVLSALDGFGAMDQARLGGVTALDRTTIIVVLTKLEERGLVTRVPSKKDKRAKIVAITEAGRRTLADVLPSALEAQKRMLGPLNGREQAQLLTLLRKMAEGNNSLSRAPHKLP